MDAKLKQEKVVILGAHPESSRYAYKAAHMLVDAGHNIIPIGKRTGTVAGHEILTYTPQLDRGEIDTVTLYINPSHQESYKDFISSFQPRRVIFNPGTENAKWASELREEGIEVDYACTLVLLATNQY